MGQLELVWWSNLPQFLFCLCRAAVWAQWGRFCASPESISFVSLLVKNIRWLESLIINEKLNSIQKCSHKHPSPHPFCALPPQAHDGVSSYSQDSKNSKKKIKSHRPEEAGRRMPDFYWHGCLLFWCRTYPYYHGHSGNQQRVGSFPLELLATFISTSLHKIFMGCFYQILNKQKMKEDICYCH